MNYYDGIDEVIVKNVNLFASKLKRQILNIELADLQQELMYEVIKCLRVFDMFKKET